MNKFVKNFLYFALFILWVSQTLFYVYKKDEGIPTLYDRYAFQDFTRSSTLMHKDDVLSASFKPSYQNLGIVQVRFVTFKRMSDDKLIFRIKEKGQTEWYYQATYKTDQFQDDELFPFGFPLIQDSQNKEYEFEIISLLGAQENNVGASKTFPSFAAKYIYSKDILNNKEELISFLLNKFVNTVSDPDVLTHSLFYLLPLVLYFYFEKFVTLKRLQKYERFQKLFTYTWRKARAIIFLSIILEVIIGEVSSNVLFISVLLFWILTIRQYKLEYRISTTISAYLILLIPFLIILGFSAAAEKIFEWIFVFFTIGVLQLGLIKLKDKLGQEHFLVKTAQRYFVKR